MIETNKVLEGAVIWSEIKDQPVNMFGFPGVLSSYVTKVAAVADALYLRPKAPAIVVELDRICSMDSIGNRLPAPRYDLSTAEEGYIILRRPAGTGKKAQEVTSPEVVEGVVLMTSPANK